MINLRRCIKVCYTWIITIYSSALLWSLCVSICTINCPSNLPGSMSTLFHGQLSGLQQIGPLSFLITSPLNISTISRLYFWTMVISGSKRSLHADKERNAEATFWLALICHHTLFLDFAFSHHLGVFCRRWIRKDSWNCTHPIFLCAWMSKYLFLD